VNIKTAEHIWTVLKDRFELSDKQLEDFKHYAALLQDWNKKINVTAIEDTPSIIASHFQDSIEIALFMDFNRVHMVADVGSGGGFPGLPLKILFPHLKLVLIEVNHKKLNFLQSVVDQLQLHDVQLIDLDWRTFLRQIDLPIDLFLARASLQPSELIRIFKAQSSYQQSRLIYWASQHWQSDSKLQPYIKREEHYEIGNKLRRYIFFENRHSPANR
jgi:16S rRNA (guanine527-N7)-methyltransferase